MKEKINIVPVIPSIDDLYAEQEVTTKRHALNYILNREPKPDWIKEHPFIKNYRYLSIEKIEYLLTSIYGEWRVEILREQIMANSVVVTIRLHYRDIISGEWSFSDGIGATPIQTAKGSSAIDFANMASGAIQMAAPSAESYAVKDAAEKLGRIFGKDLNRKDTIGFESLIPRMQTDLSNFSVKLE